jgi:hypothetical protein
MKSMNGHFHLVMLQIKMLIHCRSQHAKNIYSQVWISKNLLLASQAANVRIFMGSARPSMWIDSSKFV